MSQETLDEARPARDGVTAARPRHWYDFVRSPWFLVLMIGSAIWLSAAVITGLIQDPILMPTVILTGSFLAPVAVVTFALGRLDHSHLSPHVIFGGFLAGGTLGLFGAALIETLVLPSEHGTYLVVGIVEEACKGIVVLAVGHYVHERTGRDGMVLGAIVGAGFAAFESAGYAFQTVIEHQGAHPVLDVFNTELTRGVFSPFGHITWTALFAGAAFFASKDGRYRLTAGVVGTFVGVSLLHACWDASNGAAILVTKGLLDGSWTLTWPNTEAWVGSPTGNELRVWQLVYDLFIALWAAIGTVWVVRSWRRYGRADAEVEDRALAPI